MRIARWRSILGVLVGSFLVLSAFAHTFLGGAAITEQLRTERVSADFSAGLLAGWRFGGVAMFVFGAIVIGAFRSAAKTETVSLGPSRWIATGYLAFGIWALAVTRDPFFLIFLIPGALLALAASGGAIETP